MKYFKIEKLSRLIVLFFVLGGVMLLPAELFAHHVPGSDATIYVEPSGGSFTVGSTFTVTFYVNTGGHFINAVEAEVLFPPNKLQVVSPSTGASFIGVWTAQPSYSNINGTISFSGAIPAPGISTNAGAISTVTFRVKEAGQASIRFSDNSRVLLNDGRGTDVLGQRSSAIYQLTLPPPAGPIVSSPSHPDQGRWEDNDDVVFEWESDERISGFSYMLSQNPVEIPDDIVNGDERSVAYRNVSDGISYFHIKALRGDVWGGVTHYAVKVDTMPPAEFPIEILPRERTVSERPVITFQSTDAHSGISHYEVKIIPLTPGAGFLTPTAEAAEGRSQELFVEAQSPYVQSLAVGTYEVIVRAYDNAGNFQESQKRLEIVPEIFQLVSSRGVSFRNGEIVFSWGLVFIVLLLIVTALIFAVRFAVSHHRRSHRALSAGALNDPVIKKRLKVLKKKQGRYKKALVVVLLMVISFSMFSASPVYAQNFGSASPPSITLFSEHISNEELFYVGGRATLGAGAVVIHLQNQATGEVFNFEVPVSEGGEWFYSHDKFLSSGDYSVWLQMRLDEALSAPTAQHNMKVTPTALQFGSSRFSYELLYLILAIILLVIIILQTSVWVYHSYHGRKKHAQFKRKIKEAEESIRRGFALLRRDVQAQLALMSKEQLSAGAKEDKKKLEAQIKKDLEFMNRQIGEEIWEIEKAEQREHGK